MKVFCYWCTWTSFSHLYVFLPCVGKHRGSPNVEATVYLVGIQGHVMMHTGINNKRAVRAVSDDSQVIPRDLQ